MVVHGGHRGAGKEEEEEEEEVNGACLKPSRHSPQRERERERGGREGGRDTHTHTHTHTQEGGVGQPASKVS